MGSETKKIRMTEDCYSNGYRKGDEFVAKFIGVTASFVDKDGHSRIADIGDGRFELVEHPAKWVPKVGDRVRIVRARMKHKEEHVGEEFTIDRETYKIRDNRTWASNNGGGHYVWHADELELVATAPAAITIEAGKFYKTRDGHKVGPMMHNNNSGDRYWMSSDLGLPGYGPYWCRSGAFYADREYKHDLIAEWVDEPVAVAPAKPKFKAGDIVKFRDDYGSSARGKKATVINVSSWGIQVDLGGDYGVSTESPDDLVLFSTILPKRKPTAIVALIENGQPKPSTVPFVHATEAAAATEAKRLAGKHKGQEFGVYVLQSTAKQDAPVYEHEWQRLAANGNKIGAIKELRAATGLHLATAKTAIEDWVARVAA